MGKWIAQFQREIKSGSGGFDTYTFRNSTDAVAFFAGFPRGRQDLVDMVVIALNSGFHSDFASMKTSEFNKLFHGPWTGERGAQSLTLTEADCKKIQSSYYNTTAQNVLLREELKTLKAAYEDLFRAHNFQAQEVLRIHHVMQGEGFGEVETDKSEDLFCKTSPGPDRRIPELPYDGLKKRTVLL